MIRGNATGKKTRSRPKIRERDATATFTVDAEPSAPSSAESLCGTRLRLGGFFLSILRRCICVERVEKTSRDRGDFIDRAQERSFVRLRRFVKAADFSHELERGSSNLFGSNGRIEVEEGFDIPAHSVGPPYTVFNIPNSQAARGHQKSSHKERRGGRPPFQGDGSGLVANLERLGEYRATMGERAPVRAVRRACFVSSLTPSRARFLSGLCPLQATTKQKKSEPSSISRPTGRFCPTLPPNSTKAGRICHSRRRARSHTTPCSVSASPTSHSNFITRPSRKRLLGPSSTPLCTGP